MFLIIIERINHIHKMPRAPQVAKSMHPEGQKKNKLRLDAVREWNGKFDDKLAWAQEPGYKKGDNRYELDYFLIGHALYEGFSKRKYDSGEVYRFLKGNTWFLIAAPANNLG